MGGGPAGAGLAVHLARAGADVVVFSHEEPREIAVGESLVPAIVPALRRLGVEAAVAAISQVKPGVAFVWDDLRVAFTFARYAHRMVPYAYNVPRPGFEAVLRAQAAAEGARIVPGRVRLVRGPAGGPEVILDAEASTLTGWGAHPDLVVDASGRARSAVRLLGIDARLGPRDDVAHFAHYAGWQWDEVPGQVLIGRLPGGWSWRIPSPDRLSLGVVLDRAVAAGLGTTPEERFAGAIASAPELAATVRGATRVSGVATYANYQLITTRGYGPGWVAVGDAFGFVDPMLSPGTMVALYSAERLAAVLAPLARGGDAGGLARGLAGYAHDVTSQLEAWMELVAYLYDGRMMALVKAGLEMVEERGDWVAHRLRDYAERNVALLASGAEITSRYRRCALRLMGRYGLRGVDPTSLAID